MAHELDFTKGSAAIAYCGAIPWHGFGKALTEQADSDTWKKEAGMDWTALESDLLFHAGTMNIYEPNLLKYDDKKVLYRSDNQAPLSIVSSRYKIVQPGDMIDFFGDLIERHGFKMETAGCLFGGRMFWALARVGETANISEEDKVKPYAMIVSSVEPGFSTCVYFTTVRVVCWNTLSMAIGGTGKKAVVKVPHNKIFNHEEVRIKAGLVEDVWGKFTENAKLLSGIKLDRETALDIIVAEMKKKMKEEELEGMTSEDIEESSTAIRRIMKLYEGEGIGSQFVSTRGTAWGLLNAFTQYCDHEAGYVNGDKSAAFVRTHFGDRCNQKIRIANSLLELVA